MENRLYQLIKKHSQEIADKVVKKAVLTEPEWCEIPLRISLERAEKYNIVLADSIRQNNPNFLITYVKSISIVRKEEGLSMSALHSFIAIGEEIFIDLIKSEFENEQEQKSAVSVIKNAMASARMAASIAVMKRDE